MLVSVHVKNSWNNIISVKRQPNVYHLRDKVK